MTKDEKFYKTENNKRKAQKKYERRDLLALTKIDKMEKIRWCKCGSMLISNEELMLGVCKLCK